MELYREELIKFGALESLATINWVKNHYHYIIFKTACTVRFFPRFLELYWSSQHILGQLRYRLVN